ncbi:MAG: efflux RND transporter periplasmic adaptor subunit [Thermodesulfovibrionales bacterium]|nr:efflux RND transporter periplasmic adaptor subunit [Thermodesulfovibrionales bacterium]
MKKKIIILSILIFSIAIIFIYRTFFFKEDLKILETATVKRGDIKGILVETGIIKPQVGAVVKIGTRATGTVTKLYVRIGDRVKKGQLIAIIDDREIKEQIAQSMAALNRQENTLRQIELTYPERIREARANYEYAKLNYEREQELLKREFTTKESVERAKKEFEIAEASLKRLQDEYETQLIITRASIEEIKAQIKQLETRLSYTRIYSPMDGIVSDITIQEGETVVAGLQVANLITVFDPLSLEMWIYVDEADIGRVKIGQDVEFSVDTLPDKYFYGRIENIYPQPVVKDNIVYYLAIVKVSRQDARYLRPEMTTHVRITFDERKNTLVVPNSAIKFEEGRQIVYKVTEKGVEKVPVKIGLRNEEITEILSGLKENERVATKLLLPPRAKQQQVR